MSARRLAAYVERLLMAGELGPNIAPRVALPLRVANAAGAVAATIGLLVLTGWYARAPRLMQVHPSFVAMQFNTAVAFVLAGGAIVAGARGHRQTAAIAGLMAALLGVANLVEIFGARDLGIDQLLWSLGVDRTAMEHYAITKTSAPGRMAPNTAVGFTLAGAAVLLLTTRANIRVTASTTASAFGILILGIGLVALLGYVGGPPTAYGWGRLTRMAAPTAVAMTIIGAGVSALAAARLESAGAAFMTRLPWLVAAAGLIVTVGLCQAYADQQQAHLERDVRRTAERIHNEVSMHVDALVTRLVRMGNRWEFSGRPARRRWEHEATLNLTGLGGFEAIAWVDTGGRARWVVPSASTAMADGLVASARASGGAALAVARQRRELVLSRAIRLPNGEAGIVAAVPLFPGGNFDGLIVGVLSIRHTLDAIVTEGAVSDYGVAAFDGRDRIYPTNPPSAGETGVEAEDIAVTMHGLPWRLRVWPEAAARAPFQSSAPTIAGVIGVLLTSLLVWVTILIATAQAREREQAAANERLKEAAIARERAAELAVFNDKLLAEIAERKRAEDERQALEAQLLQSQKMEAVGQLAGGVAHDFNNMLTVITGYSAILLETLDAADSNRGDIEEIKSAAERAAGLTRQLLAFSRKQVMQPRVIDLNSEVITGLEKMLRRLIGEDIELVATLDGNLGLVNADPGQLEQVIVNLAVNARDAMPDGGRLLIETANMELGSEHAGRHIGVQAGRYVMLAVTDTGSGMSPETLARMFEPFFTTKEKGKGTGLGLATVYGIVKQSGGDIWVYSEPGQGTSFKIYLPLVEEPKSVVAAASPQANDYGGTETILLVEDDETLRLLARRILQSRGYTVLEARDGEHALAICGRSETRIDLVATDAIMPKMNGRVLAERLAAQRPGVRVLFMSGYTDDDMLRRGIMDPRMAFLQKPFTPDALAKRVREVLDGSALASAVPSLPPLGGAGNRVLK
jgi:signal transduction histidine kinase/ActR/RegA family two-component response regulator